MYRSPVPKFITNPYNNIKNIINTNNRDTVLWGIPYSIKGCRFQATLQQGMKHYWLKDNNTRMFSSVRRVRESDDLQFNDISFKSLSIHDNGTYQCVLEFPGRSILYSSQFHLNVKSMTFGSQNFSINLSLA